MPQDPPFLQTLQLHLLLGSQESSPSDRQHELHADTRMFSMSKKLSVDEPNAMYMAKTTNKTTAIITGIRIDPFFILLRATIL